MEVPGFWESTEIGKIDGTVWFRKEVSLPSSVKGKSGALQLGPIDDSDVTWINGVKVGGLEAQHNVFRKYKVPKGILKAGKNTIAVKAIDTLRFRSSALKEIR